MQIRVTGEMTIAEVAGTDEALGEMEAICDPLFTGCDSLHQSDRRRGRGGLARNTLGRVVSKVTKDGPYRSAADNYVP